MEMCLCSHVRHRATLFGDVRLTGNMVAGLLISFTGVHAFFIRCSCPHGGTVETYSSIYRAGSISFSVLKLKEGGIDVCAVIWGRKRGRALSENTV